MSCNASVLMDICKCGQEEVSSIQEGFLVGNQLWSPTLPIVGVHKAFSPTFFSDSCVLLFVIFKIRPRSRGEFVAGQKECHLAG